MNISIDQRHKIGGKSRAIIVRALWRRKSGTSRVEREKQYSRPFQVWMRGLQSGTKEIPDVVGNEEWTSGRLAPHRSSTADIWLHPASSPVY